MYVYIPNETFVPCMSHVRKFSKRQPGLSYSYAVSFGGVSCEVLYLNQTITNISNSKNSFS